MGEKIGFNSQEKPEEQILGRLGEEAIAEIRKDFPLGECENNPKLSITLFEHLLIGSTMDGQGVLDKDTPVSVLAGVSPDVAEKMRRSYYNQENGFPLGIHMLKEGEQKVVYEIVLKLQNPEIAVSSENIENIDFENTTITIIMAENRGETEDTVMAGRVVDVDKTKEIIQKIISQMEERWREIKDEALKQVQET